MELGSEAVGFELVLVVEADGVKRIRERLSCCGYVAYGRCWYLVICVKPCAESFLGEALKRRMIDLPCEVDARVESEVACSAKAGFQAADDSYCIGFRV